MTARSRSLKLEKDQSVAHITGFAYGPQMGNGGDMHCPIGKGDVFDPARELWKFTLDWSGAARIGRAWLWVKRTNENHVSFGASPRALVARLTGAFGSGGGYEGGGWWDAGSHGVPADGVYPGPGIGGTVCDSGVMGTGHGGWAKVDVTAILEAWAPAKVKKRDGTPGGASTNYGVRVYSNGEGATTNTVELWGLRADKGDRPYIVLEYDDNNTPNAPRDVSPVTEADASALGYPYSTVIVGSTVAALLLPVHMGLDDDDLPWPDGGPSPGTGTDYVTRADVEAYDGLATDATADAGTATRIAAQSYPIGQGGDPTHAWADVSLSIPLAYGGAGIQWRGRLYDKGGAAGPWCPLQKVRVDRRPLTPDNVTADPNSQNPVVSGVFKDYDPSATLAPAGQTSVRVVWSYKAPTTGVVTILEDAWHETGGGTGFAVATSPALDWGRTYRLFVQTKDQYGALSPAEGEAGAMAYVMVTPTQVLGPDNMTPRDVSTKVASRAPNLTIGHSAAFDQYALQAYKTVDDSGAGVGAALWDVPLTGTASTTSKLVTWAGTTLPWSVAAGVPSFWWRAMVHVTGGSSTPWSQFYPVYINALPTPSRWYMERADGTEVLVPVGGDVASETLTPQFRLPFVDVDVTPYAEHPIWRSMECRLASDNTVLARVLLRMSAISDRTRPHRILAMESHEGAAGLVAGWGALILTSSVANPTVITTQVAHGLTNGDIVWITGHAGSTPTINGARTVTVTGATTFTIPVNVTVAGTGGVAQGDSSVLSLDAATLPQDVAAPDAASLKVLVTSLAAGTTSVNRGPPCYLGSVYSDLSNAAVTRFVVQCRVSSKTNLSAVKFRFTFSGSGANYAEFTITPGLADIWEPRLMTKASPTATGGAVNWAQVSGFEVRVTSVTGAYTGSVWLDDLVMDPLFALGTRYKLIGQYADNNSETPTAWGASSSVTLKASRPPQPTWAGKPDGTDPTTPLPIMYWGEADMASYRMLLYRRLGYRELVAASPRLGSYWRLGEAADEFQDWGSGNGGLAHGAVLRAQADLLGSGEGASVFLDGASGYVDMGDQYDLRGLSPYSVTMEVDPTILDSTARYLAQKAGLSGGGAEAGWRLNIDAANCLRAQRATPLAGHLAALGCSSLWRLGEAYGPVPGYAAAILALSPSSYWRLGDGTTQPLHNVVKALLPDSYWRLGETSGTFADTGAVGGNAMTLHGTVERGVIGGPDPILDDGTVDLDGTTGYLDATDVYDFTGTAAFSVMAWFQLDTFNGAGAMLVSKLSGTDGWRLTVSAAGNVLFVRYGASVTDQITGAVVSLGQWHCCVVTYDGTTMKQFLDGRLTTLASSRSIANTAQVLTLGRASAASTNFMDGRIDEVAIWSRALTDDEAGSIMGALAMDQVGGINGRVDGLPGGFRRTRPGLVPVADDDGAVDFSGAQCVTFADVYDFTGTASFSFTCLFRPDAVDSTTRYVVTKDNGADGGFLVYLSAGNTINFGRRATGGLDNVGGGAAVVGTTYHLVGTYDGATLKLWVNGVKTTNAATRSMVNGTMPLTIAKNAGVGSTSYLDGVIDEVAIWSTALSDANAESLWAGVADTIGAVNGKTLGTVTRHVLPGPLAADDAGSLTLDGSTGYVDLTDAYDFAGVVPFSVVMWVRPASAFTNGARLIDKNGGGASGAWWLAMSGTSGAVQFRREDATSSDNIVSTALLTLNAWNMVAATYDGATMRLYVNAAAVVSVASTRSMPGNAQTLKVGRQVNAASNFFNGRVAEVSTIGRMLTDAEVATIYALALDATPQDVVGPTAALTAAQTRHVAYTFDGAVQRLYLEGVLAATGTDVGGRMLTPGHDPLHLGAGSYGGSYFGGFMSEVAIWPGRCLTDDEVAAHVASEAVIPSEQLAYDSGTVALSYPSGSLVPLEVPPDVLADNSTYRAVLVVTDADGVAARIGA